MIERTLDRYLHTVLTLASRVRIAQNPERALAGNQFRRGPPKRSPHRHTQRTGRDGSAPLGQHKNHKYEVEVLLALSCHSIMLVRLMGETNAQRSAPAGAAAIGSHRVRPPCRPLRRHGIEQQVAAAQPNGHQAMGHGRPSRHPLRLDLVLPSCRPRPCPTWIFASRRTRRSPRLAALP